MFRSMIGLLVGAVTGFALGYYIEAMSAPDHGSSTWNPRQGLWLGVLLSGMGAMSGVMVGAVGDVMAFLRRLYPVGVRASSGESDA